MTLDCKFINAIICFAKFFSTQFVFLVNFNYMWIIFIFGFVIKYERNLTTMLSVFRAFYQLFMVERLQWYVIVKP